MKGKIVSFFILMSIICFSYLNVIYANDEKVVDVYKEQEVEIVDEYTYSTITKILTEISRKLISIDSKFDEARITDDYTRYPFIRLGIDSPYFGLASIVESRLNVKSSVSTFDMAKGYSIRSIVNTKTMLLEDIGVSDFVLSTRKVSINENMSKSDAKKCLEKLIIYLQQVRLISDYTEIQIENIFSDYVKDSIEISKEYIISEISQIEKSLNEIEEILSLANITITTDITEDFNKFIEYEEKVLDIKKSLSSNLIETETLDNFAVEVIQLKSGINEMLSESKEKYKEQVELNVMLHNIYIQMCEKVKFLDELELKMYNEEETEESGMYAYLGRYVSSTKKYIQDISEKISNGTYDNQSLDFDEKKVEIEKNKVYDTYLKFLNSYNVLLNEYIRVNVTTIKAESFDKLNLSDELIYVFLDLDDDLKDVSKSFKKESIYSNNMSIEKLKLISLRVHAAYKKLGENIYETK